jgi:hypothetical protein
MLEEYKLLSCRAIGNPELENQQTGEDVNLSDCKYKLELSPIEYE